MLLIVQFLQLSIVFSISLSTMLWTVFSQSLKHRLFNLKYSDIAFSDWVAIVKKANALGVCLNYSLYRDMHI